MRPSARRSSPNILRAPVILRDALYGKPFYRLVHAEGDGLPGLTVDRFDDVCVAQVTTAGMEDLIAPMLEALEDVLSPRAVVLRNDAPRAHLKGLKTMSAPDAAKSLRASPSRKTACAISPICKAVKRRVGITTSAKPRLYGGARKRQDRARRLLLCRRLRDPGSESRREGNRWHRFFRKALYRSPKKPPPPTRLLCTFVKADVVEEMNRLIEAKQTFDIVIADPPPFVKARKDLEAGARAYRKVARLGASVTAKNGFLFLASCSHNMPLERFADECALGIMRTGRRASLIRQGGAGGDHPVHPMLPETAYLKALVYALD